MPIGEGPRTERGERIYAIGDVHGRFDLLEQLLERIGEHHASLPVPTSFYVVLLGDVIDRGPRSAETLSLLHDLQKRSDHVIVLAGNHEDAMVRALGGDADAMRAWLGVGGADTARSFGLEPPARGEDTRDFIRRMRATVPREWLKWLERLPLSVRSGDYLFVHAGIRPGVPLARQSRDDLLWIRRDFLDDDRDHGVVVVHGHTISDGPDRRTNRIGIDTGAYRTGILTSLYVEHERQQFITAQEA